MSISKGWVAAVNDVIKERSPGGLWGMLRFCRFVEVSRGGGSTRHPQRTEPCQCVNSHLWACQGASQSQMQAFLNAAGVWGLALGGAAVLGRGSLGVADFAGFCRFPEQEAAVGNHSAQSRASV